MASKGPRNRGAARVPHHPKEHFTFRKGRHGAAKRSIGKAVVQRDGKEWQEGCRVHAMRQAMGPQLPPLFLRHTRLVSIVGQSRSSCYHFCRKLLSGAAINEEWVQPSSQEVIGHLYQAQLSIFVSLAPQSAQVQPRPSKDRKYIALECYTTATSLRHQH